MKICLQAGAVKLFVRYAQFLHLYFVQKGDGLC